MRVRSGVLSSAVLALMLGASASVMRADTVFTNFGPSQTYSGTQWWDVGSGTLGQQVDAFSFSPTSTAVLTGADLALALVPPPGAAQTVTPLNVYIESNNGGMPGSILATLTQNGTYSPYPVTTVVNFTCSGACPTLNAGTEYWIVGQQSDPANTTGWFWSPSDSGTWFYDENNSATGPWTTATTNNRFSAFDVTGTPNGVPPAVPEPGSLALLGSGMLGIVAAARRKLSRA